MALKKRPDRKEKLKRSRTGCLCCRLRKKKCDERRPKCLGCERNFLICNWPVPKAEKERKRVRARDDGGDIESTEITLGIEPEDLQPPQESQLSIIKAEKEVTAIHSSTSCADGVQIGQKGKHKQISVPLSIRSNDINLTSPAQQQLYQNFVQKTANYMSVWQDKANPFISFIVPMASSDELVSQSIMTLSGAHLHYSKEAKDTEEWSSTYEILLIRGLKFGITRYSDNQQNALSLIVSALLLCLKETVIGSSNHNVLIHLSAIRSLLVGWISTRQASFEIGVRTFVIELYLYLAILVYVPLSLDRNPSIFEDSKLLFPYIRDTEHSGSLLGCAHALYEVIPQIAALAREREATIAANLPITQENYDAFTAILREVILWKPSHHASPDAAHCGAVWQQAVLLFLYTSFMKISDKPFDFPEVVDHAFRKAEAELSQLPLDAPISTTLNWPLAILGSCASRPQHQNLIRQHLIALGDRLQMSCYRQLLHVLENLWNGPRCKDGMSTFQEVMEEMNMIVLTV